MANRFERFLDPGYTGAEAAPAEQPTVAPTNRFAKFTQTAQPAAEQPKPLVDQVGFAASRVGTALPHLAEFVADVPQHLGALAQWGVSGEKPGLGADQPETAKAFGDYLTNNLGAPDYDKFPGQGYDPGKMGEAYKTFLTQPQNEALAKRTAEAKVPEAYKALPMLGSEVLSGQLASAAEGIKGLTGGAVDLNKTFRGAETPEEQLVESVVEGVATGGTGLLRAAIRAAIPAIGKRVTAAEAQALRREIAADLITGGVGGYTGTLAAQNAPEGWELPAGLAGGLVGGAGAVGGMHALDAATRAGVDYLRPALPTKGNVERLASDALKAATSDPAAAAEAIRTAKAPEGVNYTAGQAANDTGLLNLEQTLARGKDQEFREAMIDRAAEQNRAMVENIRQVEESGSPAEVAQFFAGRMDELTARAAQLNDNSRRLAEVKASQATDTPEAAEVGGGLQDALEGEMKRVREEIAALDKAIDPSGTMQLPTAALRGVANDTYARMSPEERLSITAEERALLDIINKYGDALPYDRFRDLRTQINEDMRNARTAGKNRAYGRMSQLRGALETDIKDAINGRFAADASLADNFVRSARDHYTRNVEREAGARPAASAVGASPGDARVLPEGAGAASPEGGAAAGTSGDQGLSPDANARRAVEGLSQSANAAATSPLNDLPEPTDAQKAAGNYAKGHVRMGGLDLSIENPAGSQRKGTDAAGKPWSVDLKDHYGYVRGSVGKDGDHLDVFVKDGTEALPDGAPVFVVDQIDPRTGRFDETKTMLGYRDRAEAEAAYRANYAKDWQGLGAITPTTMGAFKDWIKSGKTRGQFAKSGLGDPVADRTVASTMSERFAAAGRPEPEARAAGELVDAFYTTMAQRLGKSVDQVQEQFPLPKVKKGGDAGGLQQGAVETPAFRKWFGDSKVVDAEGKPLVVYHGTPADVQAFNDTGAYSDRPTANGRFGGIYFTPDAGLASAYGSKGSVYPVYLSIQNPLHLPDAAHPNTAAGFLSRDEISALRSEGYDGVVSETGREIVAFAPTQIKSTANRGTFDASDPRILFQPAYHGTPHIFDRFEWSDNTRGKGEGAQAFGDGLYFAGNKDVAKYYREALSQKAKKVAFDGVEFDGSIRSEGGVVNPQDYALFSVETEGGVDEAIEALATMAGEAKTPARHKLTEDAISWLEANRDRIEVLGGKGRLYKVDIPDDSELMDWDKPLSEQSDAVKAALKSLGIEPRDTSKWKPYPTETDKPIIVDQYGSEIVDHGDYFSVFGMGSDNRSVHLGDPKSLSKAKKLVEDQYAYDRGMTGERIYKRLSVDRRTPAAASAALREAGIPGHRFLDNGSRAKGEGTYNYVIYDDSKVNISEFEQGEGGPRGSIQFDPTGGASLIKLFETADASTALHESAHQFLHMFRQFASAADAPEALTKDWNAAKAWWQQNAKAVAKDAGAGVTAEDVRKVLRDNSTGDRMKDLAIDKGLHEQWARAFEVYLRDGKAPNAAMRGVFEQFRDFLTQVYKSVTGMGVNLSPDIRGVFDRMLGGEDGAPAPKDGNLIDAASAKRLSDVTGKWKDFYGTYSDKASGPVPAIVKRSKGETYPNDMPAENVTKAVWRPGAEGAAAIRNVLKAAGSRRDAVTEGIEQSAMLSLARQAMKDGVVDPAKFDAWKAKHSDALKLVPSIAQKMGSAADATREMQRIAAVGEQAIKSVQKTAVGELLKLGPDPSDADVARKVGSMIERQGAVKAVRELVGTARRDPDALAGLRRAVVDHILHRFGRDDDRVVHQTMRNWVNKHRAALAEVLSSEQMNTVNAIMEASERVTRKVVAPLGGSPTAEYLSALEARGESPSMLAAVLQKALGNAVQSGIVGGVGHVVSGMNLGVGVNTALATFLSKAGLDMLRARGFSKADALLREAILDPKLARALLMKAPKRKGAGGAKELERALSAGVIGLLSGNKEADWRRNHPAAARTETKAIPAGVGG